MGDVKDLRARIERGHRREDVVRHAAAELVSTVDLDFAHYRRLNLRMVRREIGSERRETVTAVVLLCIALAVGFLVARHFGASAAAGIVLSLFSLLFFGAPVLIVPLSALRHRRRPTYLFIAAYYVAIEATAVLIVFGEVVGKGPVHAIVGHVSDHMFLYLLVHGLLSYAAFMTAAWVEKRFVVLARRRHLHRDPTAVAVDELVRCVELAYDEKSFMDPDTRRLLVSHTREVALVLKHGLWRSMRVRSPLASGEFRRRCVHAGQSVELLCVRLVLPDRSTHREYLDEVLRLLDTLLSGRYGDLPDDPERASYAVRSRLATLGRIAGQGTAGLAPLAVYLLLRHFKLIPPAAEVPVLTLCVAWLATYGLNTLGRRHPDSASQFPNVLGIFGSTK